MPIMNIIYTIINYKQPRLISVTTQGVANWNITWVADKWQSMLPKSLPSPHTVPLLLISFQESPIEVDMVGVIRNQHTYLPIIPVGS